ncbi:hypothetical protein F8388_005650 [Cannabis sativa]|uniref:Very-long-chain (3R)-3-hydroxyacyl-CoA dehydratase n=1 Tax=Cannabis sativa TaxID=3483 RepID=A0A7J6ETZ8_CANSA|nr:hypothetical protein F8388_005650 [Cannabis sativa]
MAVKTEFVVDLQVPNPTAGIERPVLESLNDTAFLASSFIKLASYKIGVVRYPQHAFTCIGSCPYWITYLRYTAFIVLYPVGLFTGEMWLMYEAVPFIKKKNLYADFFSAFPFTYYTFVRVLLVLYPFLWLKLYLHLFKQRRSKLRKHDKKKMK